MKQNNLIIFIVFMIIIIVFLLTNLVFSQKSSKSNNGAVTNIWIDEESLLKLKDKKITYLFVDVGEISKNGKFISSDREIKHFIDLIKKIKKRTKHEFIILPYSEINTYNYNFNQDFKNNLVKEYSRLNKLGFHGAFVDIEPVQFKDRDLYIDLLKDLKNNLKQGALISVYSGSFATNLDNEWEWDMKFYERVSSYTDIISVQGYDTGLETEKEYREFVKSQITNINTGNFRSNFLLGIPSHNPYPEHLEIALQEYSYSVKDKSKLLGISLFAEWTMDDSEWQIFDQYIK